MTPQPSKKKPDGYCAWHPEVGWMGKEYLYYLRADAEGAIEELIEHSEADPDFLAHTEGKSREERIKLLRESGWQIRPVWLSIEPLTNHNSLKLFCIDLAKQLHNSQKLFSFWSLPTILEWMHESGERLEKILANDFPAP